MKINMTCNKLKQTKIAPIKRKKKKSLPRQREIRWIKYEASKINDCLLGKTQEKRDKLVGLFAEALACVTAKLAATSSRHFGIMAIHEGIVATIKECPNMIWHLDIWLDREELDMMTSNAWQLDMRTEYKNHKDVLVELYQCTKQIDPNLKDQNILQLRLKERYQLKFYSNRYLLHALVNYYYSFV